MKHIFRILFISFLGLSIVKASSKTIASCYDAKTELVDLIKGVNNKSYTKGSLKVNILFDSRENEYFILVNNMKQKLIYVGKGINTLYFMERTSGGNMVMYTLNNSFLTIQKSYDMFGPIMVNTYLKCM